MNTTVHIRLFLVSLTLVVLNMQSKQENFTQPKVADNLRKFYEPIKPTANGITHFLKHMYNDPEYAQDFLPNDFSHVQQLLEKRQTRSFAQSALRLFCNKLKACPYVNAYAFSNLLDHMPSLLEHYFVVVRPATEFDETRKKINKVLYAQFLHKFEDLKKNPQLFFDDLSNEILNEINNPIKDVGDIGIEELRKTALIFLEVGLGKLIWCPNDHADTWKSVKTISENLMKLTDANVLVDADDLNDLFVTLLERYCYFIDIAATDLPTDYFAMVKNDMNSPMPLFTIEEQEKLIEPKMQRLNRALAIAEARNRAYQHGMVTN